ncbi:hypothetical protein D3C87_1491850 [compost metagenome]
MRFNYPVLADANREAAFDRQRHRAAFGNLPRALIVAADTVDPATAGRQIDVPALRAGQAVVGAEALALQVEGVGVRVGHAAIGHQAVAVALDLAGAANQADSLGMAAVALQGQDRRAFEFA